MHNKFAKHHVEDHLKIRKHVIHLEPGIKTRCHVVVKFNQMRLTGKRLSEFLNQ